MSANVGCGTVDGRSCPGSSRSTPITSRSSSSAWWAVNRNSAALSRTWAGGRSSCDLERPGVQRHQGDAVGEHVVHLPCDAGSLGQARTFGADELIGLGPLGTLAQGGEELTPGADEHAPCGRGGGKRRRRQQHRPGIGPPEPDRAHHCGRNEQRGDEQGGPDMAVHSQRGQCEQAGHRAKRRECAQQDANQRHTERPASPPPQ